MSRKQSKDYNNILTTSGNKMTITTIKTRPYSVQARKRLGRSSEYGQKIYGKYQYGQYNALYGIYQVRTYGGKQQTVLSPFYIPSNPQTETQQANSAKMTAAVLAWQGLTTEQKEVYNTRAKYKNLSGYNLYLREYLLSY